MGILSLLLVLPAADPEDSLAKKMLPIYVKEVETYSLAVEPAADRPLELKKEPVFEWLNPDRNAQQGALFLWLRDGRPAALACIFSHPHDKLPGRQVMHELHALDTAKLLVKRDEYNQWKPQAGLERKELPEAAAPAATAGARLLQMRRLAQGFSGHSIDRDQKRWELRLLPTPLYRYPAGKPGVVDGALFALMSSAGTDPEVLLVLEAREAEGKLRWEYTCGRFSDWELHVQRKDKEVFASVPSEKNPFFHDSLHLYRIYPEKVVTPEGKLLARIRQTPKVPWGESSPLRTSEHAISPAVGLGCGRPGGAPAAGAAGQGARCPKGAARILCGHPGDAEHVKSLTETVRKLGDGLTKTVGIPPERQHVLFGTDRPKDLPGATGPATREAVAAAVDKVRKALRPEDGLWVICLGHGHHDGRQAWWNLPGPDLSAKEFGKLFADVACREQVFVMTSSLSGYFVSPLSRRDRVVIAATEADAETNETTFPGVFAQLLTGGLTLADHDVDKDGKLSLFDLYVVVAKEIAQNYASNEQLATEHQQLDDDGDGVGHELQTAYLPEAQGGTPAGKKPNRPPRDGLLASRVMLTR